MATERRLAAILAADIVGSSRLIEANERYALPAIRAAISEVLVATAKEYGGRLIKTMGDGALMEFASPVAAVSCAEEVQRALAEIATKEAADRRIYMRIGINLGDVVVELDGDLYGDGVNVAARLEGIAAPGEIAISAAVHDHLTGKSSIAWHDRGEMALKNVTRPVRVWSSGGATSEHPRPTLALPDRPSLAVLPFTNMSGDPDQEYFADGIVEEIITELSRIRLLFVIARNSSFTYKGRAIDLRQVGRELGVRYVLEGSVRKVGDRVRITGQLIEAQTGRHLWADKFDGALQDIFALQDQVTAAVAAAIEPNLRRAEIERARTKPTEHLDAYDLYLRALSHLQTYDEYNLTRAEELLTEAVSQDPSFAEAWGMLSEALARLIVSGWTADRQAASERVRQAVGQIVLLGEENGIALAAGAWSCGLILRSPERALELAHRALQLQPNSCHVQMLAGWARIFGGETEQAITQFDAARRLSPLDPRSYTFFTGISLTHLFARRFGEAVVAAQRAVDLAPDFPVGLRYLAAALAQAGRVPEARDVVRHLRTVQPSSTLAVTRNGSPYKQHELLDLILEGLALAGLPES